jgi:biopolymer transport protein ExbD
MAKFKKKPIAGSQSINTASLPDIVFMLLFFFMVVTTMRDSELLLVIKTPSATEVAKLEDKSIVTYIYVGKPKDESRFGTATRIQLNDAFKDPDAIPVWVEEEKSKMPQYKVALMTVSIKADRETKMGAITDVKQALRDANALKINYSTFKGRAKSKN